MTKKITLATIAAMRTEQSKEIGDLTGIMAHVVKHMATKEEAATKDQVVSLHTQVNSIEAQLRDMQHTKLHARVADLEENVYGKARH